MSAKPALVAIVNTLVDAGVDTAAALQPGQTLSAKIADYENLINDAVADVTTISDLPAEVKALVWTDYLDLTAQAVTRCGLTSDKAQKIVSATLQLISDAKTSGVVPDVLAVLAAVKA